MNVTDGRSAVLFGAKEINVLMQDVTSWLEEGIAKRREQEIGGQLV
ncbi:MAG: hypothetical protein M3A44_09125 [Gammaproteobacteria bacterium]